MKKFRLWLALKILGGRISLDELTAETYANIYAKYPHGSDSERQAQFELRLSLTRAFTEGMERQGKITAIKDTAEE